MKRLRLWIFLAIIVSVVASFFLPATLQTRTKATKPEKPWVSFVVDGGSIVVADNGTILPQQNAENVLIIRGVDKIFLSKPTINPFLLADIKKIVTTIQTCLPGLTFQLEFKGLILAQDDVEVQELTLLKDDTLPIRVGPLTDLESKFKSLHLFLRNLPLDRQENMKYIDLRVLGKLIVGYDS